MTDGVRRLSHDEAEMLISARMDEQLDRADSRALLVHLQSCESCRAFAVQSEVLGRELAVLPVLPPSAVVDRQIRESIAKGRSRWSLGSLTPAAGSSGGLRVAVGALAMLTLVSVFLLVRMAGEQTGESPSIDAPNGGVAQQLDQTPTNETALLGESTAPTATARVVIPKTPEPGATEVSAPTDVAEASTGVAAASTDVPDEIEIEPTGTLDSGFVYTINPTKTPQSEAAQPTVTASSGDLEPTATSEDASVAMAMADEGTAEPESAADESPVVTSTADSDDTPATATEASEAGASLTTTPETPVTPIEISVDATEAPPTVPSPDDVTEEIEVGSPEPTATPDALAPTQAATEADQVETPAQPYDQPTIAPMAGQTGGQQETGESQIGTSDTSPQIVPSNGGEIEKGSGGGGDDHGANSAEGTEEAGNDGQNNESSDSPPIVPADGTSVSGGVGGSNGQSSGNGNLQSPTPVPTVDDSIQPSGLDLSTTVTTLPSGTTSPAGRLAFSPGMNLYVVVAPDGQLAVADLNGELVVMLGASSLPVWSGSGLMFSTQGASGSEVGIWNSETGELSYIPPSANEASDDLPIGGNGSSFYYLRTYPDSGIVELRSATIDGADNGVIWTDDDVTLAAPRPLYSESGVYLPTDSEWLYIDWSGAQSSLGPNPYGFIGTPVLSPGGGLMAYAAGDQVIVAWTTQPGEPAATAPFTPPGSYAFSTSGEEIVISDGSSLYVISYEGVDLGRLEGNQPIGGVYWIEDDIYYLQIGEDAALKSTSLEAIQSGA